MLNYIFKMYVYSMSIVGDNGAHAQYQISVLLNDFCAIKYLKRVENVFNNYIEKKRNYHGKC